MTVCIIFSQLFFLSTMKSPLRWHAWFLQLRKWILCLTLNIHFNSRSVRRIAIPQFVHKLRDTHSRPLTFWGKELDPNMIFVTSKAFWINPIFNTCILMIFQTNNWWMEGHTNANVEIDTWYSTWLQRVARHNKFYIVCRLLSTYNMILKSRTMQIFVDI